ncbi:MAG TPA: CHASE domain-containing protein, partial [Pseudomonadales bacterium]|nr:CHASE domain-containing protein [Pseudomonadales bacterium]
MGNAPLNQLRIALVVVALAMFWLWSDFAFHYSPTEAPPAHVSIISTGGLLFALVLGSVLSVYLHRYPLRTTQSSQGFQRSQRPALHAGIAFVCVLLISTAFIHLEHHREAAEKQASTIAIAASYADSLSNLIDQSESATTALGYLIQAGKGQITNFEAIANDLLRTTPGITNLQLAPEGVVMQVIPLKGNEKAIGHDLLGDPKRNKEAFDAVKTGQLTLAGPFTLLQGGVAVIARQPVFINDPQGNSTFWGFTSALMLLEPLLERANINDLEAQLYAWTLHRVHPDTGRVDIFASSSAPLTTNAVSHSIVVPNGEWMLSLSPMSGWISFDSLAIDS